MLQNAFESSFQAKKISPQNHPTAKNKQTEISKIQFQHVNHYSLSTWIPKSNRDTHITSRFRSPQRLRSPRCQCHRDCVPFRIKPSSNPPWSKPRARGLMMFRLDGLRFGRGNFFPKTFRNGAKGYGNGKSRNAIKIKQLQNVWWVSRISPFFLVSRSLGGVSYNDPCLAPSSTWRMGSQDGRIRGDEWKGWDPQPWSWKGTTTLVIMAGFLNHQQEDFHESAVKVTHANESEGKFFTMREGRCYSWFKNRLQYQLPLMVRIRSEMEKHIPVFIEFSFLSKQMMRDGMRCQACLSEEEGEYDTL